jgi:uncharacterized membrane protein YgdD (TMEM256/DUF423 family)
MTPERILGVLGSFALLTGVALGAFAAHALRDHLTDSMRAVFETGVRYQMIHGIAILFAAWMTTRGAHFYAAGLLYAAGIALFSFSLYALAVTGMRKLGIITPLGGVCFLAGHLMMLVGFWRLKQA